LRDFDDRDCECYSLSQTLGADLSGGLVLPQVVYELAMIALWLLLESGSGGYEYPKSLNIIEAREE
jgi:hypothetical protein